MQTIPNFHNFLRYITPLASRLHSHLMEEMPSVASVQPQPQQNGVVSQDKVEELVDKIKAAVTELSEAHFQPHIALPRPGVDWSSVVSESLYSMALPGTSDMEVCIFGFERIGVGIPLHDHPGMHAFMRVLRGRLRIASFSVYSPEEFQECGLAPIDGFLAARYEGVVELTNQCQSIALAPRKNNIHMVTDMEAGTTIIDVFVPGYRGHDCNYYTLSYSGDQASFLEERTLDGFNVGQLCWLRRTAEPKNLRIKSI